MISGCYYSSAVRHPSYHSTTGIGYLASYLKSKYIECTIVDGLNLGLDNKEIVKQVKHAQIVGISVLSYYFLKAIDLSKRLKKQEK